MERKEIYGLIEKCLIGLNITNDWFPFPLGPYTVDDCNLFGDSSFLRRHEDQKARYLYPELSYAHERVKTIKDKLNKDPYYFTRWKILITDDGCVNVYVGIENDRSISLSRFTYAHMIHLSPERVTHKNILTAIQSLIFFLKNKDYALYLYKKAKAKPQHLLCWDIKYYSKLICKRKISSKFYKLELDCLYNSI